MKKTELMEMLKAGVRLKPEREDGLEGVCSLHIVGNSAVCTKSFDSESEGRKRFTVYSIRLPAENMDKLIEEAVRKSFAEAVEQCHHSAYLKAEEAKGDYGLIIQEKFNGKALIRLSIRGTVIYDFTHMAGKWNEIADKYFFGN